MSSSRRIGLLLGSSAIAIIATVNNVIAQDPNLQPPATPATPPPAQPAAPPGQAAPPGSTQIPQITVTAPKRAPARTAAPRPATTAPTVAPQPTQEQAEAAQRREVTQRLQTFDQRRDNIEPKTGTFVETKTQKDLDALPQGANINISDLVLQYPGVSQDSTSSGDFHVRNEHANVQFRLNGIWLPDGVSGYSQFLDTSFLKSMSLITGALPAQYGFHTSGIMDITTKGGTELQGGEIGVYGGSRETFTNYFNYGGVKDNTEYFFTGRYFDTGLGLENPAASLNAIHDQSALGRFFGYTSTALDESNRISTIVGMAVQRFQIPDNPGQPVNVGGFSGVGGAPYTVYGIANGNSSAINENQYEKNAFAVVAWQHSAGDIDSTLEYFSRYSSLHYVPDVFNDLLFNNVATDVFRSSFLNGIQGDMAYRITNVHTIRVGFIVDGEQTTVANTTAVLPLDPAGEAIDAPFNIVDSTSKFGWLMGGYIQDEWKVTDHLTLNTGVRFDQMLAFVNANQISPRFNLTYNPWWGTVFHAGYSRNFTPPPQVLGSPYPFQEFNNTTNAAASPFSGSILPERSNVYDVGVTQQLLPRCPTGTGGMFTKAPTASTNCPALEVAVDGYYKQATDLLDDGQFGQAYVLTAFNYAKGENIGVEAKAKFTMGNFTAYGNVAAAHQTATDIVSNQSLFSPDDLAYIATHYIYTDHTQLLTGSAGVSYQWKDTGIWWMDGTKMSSTMIYGSGLRSGFVNTDHVPSYTQINVGLSREFANAGWDAKPITVRFDVVNLLDEVYQIRSGTGIGVFAPQYGPRRGFYLGISQKL